MKAQSLTENWNFRKTDEQDWFLATVPGGVHTDLLNLGKIPDPFVGDNEKRVQWVAESDWEYRTEFDVLPELFSLPQIWLVCDGLDTLATITLNGQIIGRTENMFRQYQWDIKHQLKEEKNILLVSFDSPVKFAAAKQAIRPMPGVTQAIPGGPYLRKAPCQFGWDWGPQLPPIGIWKDIRLEGYDNAHIVDVRFHQRHLQGRATVEAKVQIQSWNEEYRLLVFRLIAPDGQCIEQSCELHHNCENSLIIDIPNPEIWWPNGYGQQPLYHAVIALKHAKEIIDERNYQLGLRTVELHQQLDEWGRSFQFVVNGVSIFAKGSNWIPADSFPTRITRGSLEMLIQSAVQTHQNMLRVWGGGFYEDENFYDLCDKYGILVWQEFIFSCSIYPLDDLEFLENIHEEVMQNVRRLRHRACLALWCGNNEMELGWVDWGWKAPEYQDMKTVYDQFFHHTLPAWCEEEDSEHTYWPSSPSSDTPFENPNGQQQGDAHYWDVWHGRKPFSAYRDQFPRFMSEFGFQALPPLQTIRTFADKPEWNMTSYLMEQHQKNASGNSLMVGQMLDSFRLPKDFDSLVYLSMVLQSEGIRYGVEHWRRHVDRVAGTLYWQLNDCWPVASWSSLDYYGRWKALHYAARRFYAPLMLSVEDIPPVQSIYITNDSLKPWHGNVHWSLETLSGEVIDQGTNKINVGAQSVAKVEELDFSNTITDDNKRNLVFIAELMQGDRLISRQAAYFAPIKHLSLFEPGIEKRLRVDKKEIYIQLRSDSLALLVELSLNGVDVVFSDNYFNLPTGRVIQVTCPLPEGWDLRRVEKELRVRSVFDSFSHSGKE